METVTFLSAIALIVIAGISLLIMHIVKRHHRAEISVPQIAETKTDIIPRPEATPETDLFRWWRKKVGMSTDELFIVTNLSVLTKDQCKKLVDYLISNASLYNGGDLRYQSRCDDEAFVLSKQRKIVSSYIGNL